MKLFHHILQKKIGVEIKIDSGCIGSRNSEILIVEEGRIKCIGQFNYSLWSERNGEEGVLIALEELGEEAEKYRLGQRKTLPCIGYNSGKWGVRADNNEKSAEQINKDFVKRGGKVNTAYLFANGNIAVFDEKMEQVPFLQYRPEGLSLMDHVSVIKKFAHEKTQWFGFPSNVNA